MKQNKNVQEQDLEDRQIVVKDDGSVEITEVIKTVYTQDYREFLSDVRQLEKLKEDINKTITDEFKEKQQERIEKLDTEIEKFKSYVKISEKNYLETQKRQRIESMVDALKNELKKPKKDINHNMIVSAWEHCKHNDKEVLDHLSEQELNEMKRVVLKHNKR